MSEVHKRRRCFSCGNYRSYPDGWKWVFKNGKKNHERCPACCAVRNRAISR